MVREFLLLKQKQSIMKEISARLKQTMHHREESFGCLLVRYTRSQPRCSKDKISISREAKNQLIGGIPSRPQTKRFVESYKN